MRPIPPIRPGPQLGQRQTSRRRRVEWCAAASRTWPPLAGEIAFLQIIVGGSERTIRRAIGIEMSLRDDGNSAVLAHLDEVGAARRSRIHPVPALEFSHDTIDGALHSEGLAALDAAKWLLLLQYPGRRGRGAEIDLGLQGDDLFRTGHLAEPALHAGVLDKAQHRPLRVIPQRAGRTCRHAGQAKRAVTRIDFDRPEWRPLWERDNVDGIVSRTMKFAQGESQHFAPTPRRLKACRPRRRRHPWNLPQGDTDHIWIIGLQY